MKRKVGRAKGRVGRRESGVKRGANASGAFGDGSLIRDPQKRVRQPFSRLPVTKPDGEEGTRDVNYKALIGNPSLLLLAYAPVHASRVRQRRRKTEYREHSRVARDYPRRHLSRPPSDTAGCYRVLSLLSSRLCPIRLRSKGPRVSSPALLPPDSTPAASFRGYRLHRTRIRRESRSRVLSTVEKNLFISIFERNRYEY